MQKMEYAKKMKQKRQTLKAVEELVRNEKSLDLSMAEQKRHKAQSILDQKRKNEKMRERDALRDYKRRIKELRYGPEQSVSPP